SRANLGSAMIRPTVRIGRPSETQGGHMVRARILAVAIIVALGGAAGIAQAGDKPDAAEMAKLMAAKTSLSQAIAIAEKETGGKAIDAGFDNEDGTMSLKIEV